MDIWEVLVHVGGSTGVSIVNHSSPVCWLRGFLDSSTW